MNHYLIKVFIVTVMLLVGCTSSNEQGIKDERKGFMSALEKSLTENNIPFRVDGEGHIRYSIQYGDAVEKIISSIDYNVTHSIGTSFEHKESTEYFRGLLKKRDIEYRAEVINGQDWTYWVPENKTQADELELMAITYYFERAKAG
ncbi:MAG: hypothetical protein U1B30_02810 [Pseudomonadota bacterium]|nr:hypothetical protein [Pseudomonadota bacterium]